VPPRFLLSNTEQALCQTEPSEHNVTDLEERIIDLEIKAGFTEDLVEQLNQVVVRQQQQIDALIAEVLALRQQSADASPPGFRSLRDELPPHY
jgi:SlyX protein